IQRAQRTSCAVAILDSQWSISSKESTSEHPESQSYDESRDNPPFIHWSSHAGSGQPLRTFANTRTRRNTVTCKLRPELLALRIFQSQRWRVSSTITTYSSVTSTHHGAGTRGVEPWGGLG
ncbi:hypothetical protein OTU49_003094, partial [Cherax quadricarinatus]